MNDLNSLDGKHLRTTWWADTGFPPVVLAPMAGITDSPYRIICSLYGADGTVTEMVSAEGLVRDNPNTWELLIGLDGEEHCAVQLFGRDPVAFSEGLARMVDGGFVPAGIDVNMGCPVPKVVRSGAGAALMKDPKAAAAIVRSVRRRLEMEGLSIPLWAKIRSGWDENSVNAPEIATVLADAGVDGLAVHARTRSAYYSGDADWEVIRAVVEVSNLPVLGNGDVFSGERAQSLLDETGCHGIMVGRGAMGAPWIFGEIRATLGGLEGFSTPDPRERISVALCHLEMESCHRGSERAARFMRKHLHWYTRGLPGSAMLRDKVNHAGDAQELADLLVKYRRGLCGGFSTR